MHAFLKVGRIRLKYTADIRKLINAQRSLEAILLSLRPSAEIVGVAPWDESGGGGEKGAIENRYALGRNPINGEGGGGFDARVSGRCFCPRRKTHPTLDPVFDIEIPTGWMIADRNRRNILPRANIRVSGKTRGRVGGIFNNVDPVTPRIYLPNFPILSFLSFSLFFTVISKTNVEHEEKSKSRSFQGS